MSFATRVQGSRIAILTRTADIEGDCAAPDATRYSSGQQALGQGPRRRRSHRAVGPWVVPVARRDSLLPADCYAPIKFLFIKVLY